MTDTDKFSSGQSEFFAAHDGNARLRLIQGDLLDTSAIGKAVKGNAKAGKNWRSLTARSRTRPIALF